MMAPIAWKAGLALAALFTLGAASGFVVARRLEPPAAPARSGSPVRPASLNTNRADNLARRWGENRKANYLKAAKPTPQQAAAIERHFQALNDEVARIQVETRREIQRAVRQMNKSIEQELSPAQRKALQERVKKYEPPGD
jgi:hypothetical protein